MSNTKPDTALATIHEDQFDPEFITLFGIERIRRFWSNVDASGDCWVWKLSTNRRGYGQVTMRPGHYECHRIAYQMIMGRLDRNVDLDHLCRNPRCVNPDHLEPVSHRVNLLRGYGPSGLHARQTHCKRGHEFTPENTYLHPRGLRLCLTCKRAYARERYHRLQGRVTHV